MAILTCVHQGTIRMRFLSSQHNGPYIIPWRNFKTLKRTILWSISWSRHQIKVMLYSHLQRHNDKDTGRKTHDKDAGRMQEGRHEKTSLENIYLSLYCKGLKGLFKGLHVRGCWRPNVNFIFWPHCYDRHAVSCSPDVGVHSIGAFRDPPRSGVAFPTTSGLYSLEFDWQLHRGFPRCPSVGCGLPYHIWSLTLWESAGNCFGGFRGPPRSGVAFPTTSRL